MLSTLLKLSLMAFVSTAAIIEDVNFEEPKVLKGKKMVIENQATVAVEVRAEDTRVFSADDNEVDEASDEGEVVVEAVKSEPNVLEVEVYEDEDTDLFQDPKTAEKETFFV